MNRPAGSCCAWMKRRKLLLPNRGPLRFVLDTNRATHQVVMLDSVRSRTGRHDFHIVPVRDIRCGCFRSVLSPDSQDVSGPIAGYRKLVLLRLWPARTFAASGGRSYRNLCVFDFGFVESRSMAADRHRLQSRAVGVL